MQPDEKPTTKRRPRAPKPSTIERVASGVIEGTLGLLPALSADDRAELRTAAYPILAASRTAAGTVQQLAQRMPPTGFWQAAVMSGVSALSAIASGLCLLGATVALVASADDTSTAPAARPAPAAPPPPPEPPPTAPADGAAAAHTTDTTKES